jgi:hypothetical protein
LAPILETNINKKLFYENYDENRTSSIGSDEVVVILNPTSYTLKDDEDIEQEIMEHEVV